MNRFIFQVLSPVWLLAGIIVISFPACARKTDKKNYVKDCILPDDQRGTITGRWPITPIPVATASATQFFPEDVADVTAAVETWNDFYETVNGYPLLQFDGAVTNRAPPDTSGRINQACSFGILGGGDKYNGSIGLYKSGNWPYDPDVIALTSFCTPAPDTPIDRLYAAYIEFNFRDFFVQGASDRDFQTIVLHEFGHLLGLGHSCETDGAPGYPTCSSAMNSEYFFAVMFPSFPEGQAGVKRQLGKNDMGRANCLYYDVNESN